MNPEDMQNEIDQLRADLDNTNEVLGRLIAWLQNELGTHNVAKLLEMLDD